MCMMGLDHDSQSSNCGTKVALFRDMFHECYIILESNESRQLQADRSITPIPKSRDLEARGLRVVYMSIVMMLLRTQRLPKRTVVSRP